MTLEAFLQLTVFGSTVFALALHPLEWFEISRYRRRRRDELRAGDGLGFLKSSLDLESCYYLFVLGFLLIFYREPLLLALVLVMTIAHVAARRSVSRAPSLLRDRKRLSGALAFDVLELIFLAFLISEFWSLIGGTL
jgi:hypothetical protein